MEHTADNGGTLHEPETACGQNAGMLTKEALATRINGREYLEETTREDLSAAKAAGLVIAYGASDDLLEVSGAWNDEFGAWEGTEIEFTDGLLVPTDEEFKTMSKFGVHLPAVHWLKAEWCPEDEPGLSWRITCSLPSAPFMIYEDGEPFCRGVVFAAPSTEAE